MVECKADGVQQLTRAVTSRAPDPEVTAQIGYIKHLAAICQGEMDGPPLLSGGYLGRQAIEFRIETYLDPLCGPEDEVLSNVCNELREHLDDPKRLLDICHSYLAMEALDHA